MRLSGLAALTFACACAATQASTGTYLTDPASRRSTLEASLVNPHNAYSTLRLDHYSTGKPGDWDALPEWNPAGEPLTQTSLPTPLSPLSTKAAPLTIDARASLGNEEALRALGEQAFFRYPVQLAYAAEAVLASGVSPDQYGLSSDPQLGIGGLVRVRTTDGATHLAYTCATCHTSHRNGALVVGVTNDKFDMGKLIADAGQGADPRDAALRAWGPGRVDVTSSLAVEPVRIGDLRALRHVGYLHHTASVAQLDLATLAIRLETLVIVSNSLTVRPPREVALGLALYVWSLADALSTRAPNTDQEKQGQAVFSANCSNCHAPPFYTGAPVSLQMIGTDPVVGRSLDRQTGNYRVPSLLGVKDRGLLLHDASADSLETLFDPSRVNANYRSRLGKPIMGHMAGLDLNPTDRAALLAFLRTL